MVRDAVCHRPLLPPPLKTSSRGLGSYSAADRSLVEFSRGVRLVSRIPLKTNRAARCGQLRFPIHAGSSTAVRGGPRVSRETWLTRLARTGHSPPASRSTRPGRQDRRLLVRRASSTRSRSGTIAPWPPAQSRSRRPLHARGCNRLGCRALKDANYNQRSAAHGALAHAMSA